MRLVAVVLVRLRRLMTILARRTITIVVVAASATSTTATAAAFALSVGGLFVGRTVRMRRVLNRRMMFMCRFGDFAKGGREIAFGI